MKDKFDFIWAEARKAVEGINSKKISVDQGKAVAALLKQSNNVLATQIDVAKFLRMNKEAEDVLYQVGLIDDAS